MAASSPLVGRTLGHYQILGEAGSGGMGVVYRARDERLDRIVALKVLPPGALLNENARKRFRKEALALAKLNHPNIAIIHDFDTQEGIDFLVMEFVDGVTLASKLADRALPEKQVISLGTQIARTLEYAHEHGVVHRDLKPGNVMVTSQDQLKLLDFGLARLVQTDDQADTESLSEFKGAGGTLPYMAPEQVHGEATDQRTDIYAAGAVLYEMSTGQRPFPQRETTQLIAAILHEDPVPPSQVSRQVSPLLEAAILKALDKDPEHRYQSAKELRVDLERMELPGTMRIVPLRRSRNRKVGPAAALLSLLLVVGYWWYSHRPDGTGKAPEARQVLVADFENRTGDADFEDSLSTALSTYLEQSNAVRIFSPSRVHAAVQTLGGTVGARIDNNLGSRICVREGIPLMITGEISRLRDQYLLAVRVLNPADQRVLSVHTKEAARKDEVLGALGSAAREVRVDIGEQRLSLEKNDRLPEQVTTASLSALQLYSLARKEHLDGNYNAAIPLYKNAIRLDPQFALANARLSTVYRNLGDSANARSYMGNAVKLLDHVTERERYTLLGLSAVYDEDYGQAIGNFLVLTKLYPDDGNGHFHLALCYLVEHKFDEALGEARTAARLDPSPLAYTNLAEILLAKNQFQDVVDLSRSNPGLQYEGGLVKAYLGLGQIDSAQNEVDRLLATHDERAHALAAKEQLLILLFVGQWQKAGKFLEDTIAVGNDPTARALWRAALFLQRGDRTQAAQWLRNAERTVNPLDSQNASFVILAAQARESRVPREFLREIESQSAPREVQRVKAYENLVRGTLALEEGLPKRAVPYLQSARGDWDDILVRYTYAQALFENAQWQEAENEFREINRLKGLALDEPIALLLWKISPYWMARSQQAQGNTGASRQSYHAFLQGWPEDERQWPTTRDAVLRLQQLN